jgi:predicted  nucleic acid-binding Zn-ribbon protein
MNINISELEAKCQRYNRKILALERELENVTDEKKRHKIREEIRELNGNITSTMGTIYRTKAAIARERHNKYCLSRCKKN